MRSAGARGRTPWRPGSRSGKCHTSHPRHGETGWARRSAPSPGSTSGNGPAHALVIRAQRVGGLPAGRDHLAGPGTAERQRGSHPAPGPALRGPALRAPSLGAVQPGHDLPRVPGAPGRRGARDRRRGAAGRAHHPAARPGPLRSPAGRARSRSLAGQRGELGAAPAPGRAGPARRRPRPRRPARSPRTGRSAPTGPRRRGRRRSPASVVTSSATPPRGWRWPSTTRSSFSAWPPRRPCR